MKEKRMDENTKRFVSISEKPGTSGLNFHNQGYRLLGLNCVYFPLEIHSSKLGKAIQIVKDNFDKYFSWRESIFRHEDHQKVLLQSKRILKAPNSWSAHFPN